MEELYSVFGGRGFIGSNICTAEQFVSNEDSVDDKNKFPAKTNKIVYLISTTHNYHVLDNNPYIDIETNLHHLMTVLQSNRMKYGNDFEITFVSSWFVYGNTDCPASEVSNCNPTGFYSITKYVAERLLTSYCDTFGIKWKIVRLANVMGIGDKNISKRKNALQYMVKELSQGREVNLYRGDIYRDYIHVSDASKAIRKVAMFAKGNEIYNIGSGVPSKISDLVYFAELHSGNLGRINVIDVPDFHKKVQVESMWLNSKKIKQEIGWVSTITPQETIKELIKHYKESNEN